MGQEEKIAVLLTKDRNGKSTEREITQEELGQLFFNEGNHEWDQVHTVLPEPVWEKLYDDEGFLVYEGYTLDHKAFGAGRTYYRDGSLNMEGVFGIKGLLCGRDYYSDGRIRFEGQFRINQAYGPNFPEYGIWYGRNGEMVYRGKFIVLRSSLGWPRVYKPDGFGSVPHCVLKYEHLFMWETARKIMKEQPCTEQKQVAASPDVTRHEKQPVIKKHVSRVKSDPSFSEKYIRALLERATPESLLREHKKLLEGKTPNEQRKIRDRLSLDILAEYPYKPLVELDYLEGLREKHIDERNWLKHLDEMTDREITFMLEQHPGKAELDLNRKKHPEISDRVRAEFLRDFG